MLLSVVIPARNVERTLAEQLDALVAQSLPGPWEIIVVDNGSSDATPDIVRGYSGANPEVKLVQADDGRGCGFGRNRGAALARSDRLAFCDGDDVVARTWVAGMYAGLGEFGYVTGPLDVDRLNPAWLVQARGRWVAQPQIPVYGEVLPYANGCNIGVRRDVLLAVGGFDESMSSGEDVEFALRVHLKGVELGWVADSLVHYRYRPELAVLWRQGRAYGGIQPHLLSRLRAAGLRPRFSRFPWKNLLWLGRHLLLLRSHHGRARWLWVAANCAGFFDGLRRRSRRA